MSRFFGLSEQEMGWESMAADVVSTQRNLANVIVGLFGILVAVLTCSGYIPSMLKKGSLDLVLARPIGRRRLLFYKYLGSLWFVLIIATFLITGSMLAITLRTGYFNPWFLGTIPVLLLSFAVIYSLVTLMGVVTRSGTVAALVGIGVWWAGSIVHEIRWVAKLTGSWDGWPAWARNLLETSYTVLPKTSDLAQLNNLMLSRSQLSDDAYERLFVATAPDIDWLFSLGTTGLFAAVMLGLAMRRFNRTDY